MSIKTGVRQSDLARAWGVSRQTVSRYVKAGMPLGSVEEAEAWRMRVKGKGGSKAPNSYSSAEEGGVPKNDESLAGLLDRVKKTETQIWQRLENFSGGYDEERMLLRLHKDAAATRLKVQQEVLELDQKTGRLVEIEDAKRVCRSFLAPLAVGLRGMGNRLAVKANPGRPDMAQRAIDEEVQRLLAAFEEDSL